MEHRETGSADYDGDRDQFKPSSAVESNDGDLTSQAAYGRPSKAQSGALAASMSAEKYIKKASSNDLPTLLSRQENMLALVKKEFNLHDDSPQTQAELTRARSVE